MPQEAAREPLKPAIQEPLAIQEQQVTAEPQEPQEAAPEPQETPENQEPLETQEQLLQSPIQLPFIEELIEQEEREKFEVEVEIVQGEEPVVRVEELTQQSFFHSPLLIQSHSTNHLNSTQIPHSNEPRRL